MKKRATGLLTWYGVDLTSSVCADHGQQPMKMHTEVTLLYNSIYLYTAYAAHYVYIVYVRD